MRKYSTERKLIHKLFFFCVEKLIDCEIENKLELEGTIKEILNWNIIGDFRVMQTMHSSALFFYLTINNSGSLIIGTVVQLNKKASWKWTIFSLFILLTINSTNWINSFNCHKFSLKFNKFWHKIFSNSSPLNQPQPDHPHPLKNHSVYYTNNHTIHKHKSDQF